MFRWSTSFQPEIKIRKNKSNVVLRNNTIPGYSLVVPSTAPENTRWKWELSFIELFLKWSSNGLWVHTVRPMWAILRTYPHIWTKCHQVSACRLILPHRIWNWILKLRGHSNTQIEKICIHIGKWKRGGINLTKPLVKSKFLCVHCRPQTELFAMLSKHC